MHIIIGNGKNGRAIATILKKLDIEFKTFDVRPEASDLKSIKDVFGVVHISVREQDVKKVVEDLNGLDINHIIIHSTMPLKWTRRVAEVSDHQIFYMPMFFREAQPELDALKPNRIVVGYGEGFKYPLPFAVEFSKETGTNITYVTYEMAEIIKLGTNSMRANFISFFNELYAIAKTSGCESEFVEIVSHTPVLAPANVLDKWETKTGWGRNSEKFGDTYGGFCLPKDSEYLGIRTVKEDNNSC